MKAFLIFMMLVLVLVIAGWLTFGRSHGEPAVILETNQIQQDTEKAAAKGKELLHDATQKVDELRNDQRSGADAGSATATPSDEAKPDDTQRAAPPAERQ